MVCFQLLSCYLKYCVYMVGSLFNCAGEGDKGHLRMDIFNTFFVFKLQHSENVIY